MNIDANIQKLLTAVMRKWKLVLVIAIIGSLLAFVYTQQFTTLTYSSSVKFLTYAQDSQHELADSSTAAQAAASNTSKMNYAIKMLTTYVELFNTNEFNQRVADSLNEKYSTSFTANQIKNTIKITPIEETAMFNVVVTTTDAELSYRIAHELETCVPEKMKETNNGLVHASVEDKAIKAAASESRGYAKKCAIGFLAGAVLAVVYIILRDLIDVRIKSSDELLERYEVPILGTIPKYEIKSSSKYNDKKAETRKES